MALCRVCNHPFTHQHRIVPGAFGGRYEDANVLRLCPNHHAAVHFLMRTHPIGNGQYLTSAEFELAETYRDDKPLWTLWTDIVLPTLTKHFATVERS